MVFCLGFDFWKPHVNILLVLASIAICISLLILTPEKQSAKWVFTHFTDGSGWGNKGFSFLLGYVFRCMFQSGEELISI
jgi:L-asparagine transporter-like permease